MRWNAKTEEPLGWLIQRVAIDFDSLDYWEVYAALDKLKHDGYKPKIWRTRNGYHIVSKLQERQNRPKIGFWSLLKLRSRYGDDEKRISSDIMRITDGWPVDCMFDQKGESDKYLIRWKT